MREGIMSETCIDNIFTNSGEILEQKIYDWNVSDHLVIAVKRKRAKIKSSKVSFTGRSYKNYDKEIFQELMINENWEQFYAETEPAACWDILESKIRGHLDRICPQKEFKVKEVKDPWISNEILEEIKDKDRLLFRARRTKKVEDWVLARQARNRVGGMIVRAKADFLKEQQRDLAGDPKKFWRVVKTIVPRKRTGNLKITLNDEARSGKRIEGNEVADHINNFFTQIGPKLAEKHKRAWDYAGERVQGDCQDFRADYESVLNRCREINIAKSSGYNDISSKIFKDAFMVLVNQLVYMFNLSFKSGSFPDGWKVATIIPLYKGGNYREL